MLYVITVHVITVTIPVASPVTRETWNWRFVSPQYLMLFNVRCALTVYQMSYCCVYANILLLSMPEQGITPKQGSEYCPTIIRLRDKYMKHCHINELTNEGRFVPGINPGCVPEIWCSECDQFLEPSRSLTGSRCQWSCS